MSEARRLLSLAGRMNWVINLVVLLLIVTGVLFIYSATHTREDVTVTLWRQQSVCRFGCRRVCPPGARRIGRWSRALPGSAPPGVCGARPGGPVGGRWLGAPHLGGHERAVQVVQLAQA